MGTFNESEYEKVFDGKLSQPLAYAALGCPHMVVTQVEDDVIAEATPGFDTDNLFLVIKDLARSNSKFKEALADYIIELSKEV